MNELWIPNGKTFRTHLPPTVPQGVLGAGAAKSFAKSFTKNGRAATHPT